MPSEPTPTTPAQRAALHALTEQAQALGLGYDRPSAPTDDLRNAVRDLLAVLPHPEHLTGCGTVYQTTLDATLVDRLRRGLRGDTGASHEQP
jgi:hypothetical protein